MKRKEWTKATRGNGHPIPKLWVRASGTYYAQMAVLNPNSGKNEMRKICLDTRECKVAENKLAGLISDRATGKLKLRDLGPLLKDFLPHFLEVRKQERDIKTYRNERSFLQRFSEFAGTKRLGEITVRDVLDYRTTILKTGIVNHTANLHVIAIRNLFKQAVAEGLVENNPALKVAKLDHISKPKFLLTDEQIVLLANRAREVLPVAGQQVSDWILVMAYSGGRMSEVLSLKWSDIDFAGRKLTFRRETVKFKANARSVDFNPKLEGQLKEMNARRDQTSEWLFSSSRAEGARVGEYGHDLAKVTKKAGMPKVTSHFFRHYFISSCAKMGVAMRLVIDWVGHKDYRMVNEVYTHLPPAFRQSEAQKLTFETKDPAPELNPHAQP